MQRAGDQQKRIDENHPGLKLTGKWLIIESVILCLLILAAYLYRHFR